MSPYGGDERVRTADPLLAGQVLYQLSYTPVLSPHLRKIIVRITKIMLRNRSKFCIKNE